MNSNSNRSISDSAAAAAALHRYCSSSSDRKIVAIVHIVNDSQLKRQATRNKSKNNRRERAREIGRAGGRWKGQWGGQGEEPGEGGEEKQSTENQQMNNISVQNEKVVYSDKSQLEKATKRERMSNEWAEQ